VAKATVGSAGVLHPAQESPWAAMNIKGGGKKNESKSRKEYHKSQVHTKPLKENVNLSGKGAGRGR
jgi:hypothetical protein